MSEPVLECVNPWETACLCGARHMPCWPRPDTSCCDRLEPVDPTPEQTLRIERMLHVATEIIWRLSGKQFGACPITVRPCRQDCANRMFSYGYWSGSEWTPVLDGGTWFNQNCGKCAGPHGCSCTEICEIDLPGPVAEVLEVKQDGVVLDPSMYRVDNARKLVRLPTVREATGTFIENCLPFIPNRVCLNTPSGDRIEVGGNESDIAPGGATFTLLSNVPFSVVFGRGRQVPRITMRLCPGAVMTWDIAAVSVTSDIPLAAQTLTSLTVGAAETSVTITFPSAALPSDTMTPDFTITGADGCGHMDLGAASYLAAGEACWPTCQDMVQPDTAPGTLSVRYRRGQAVPQGGLWAAGLLACQLLKACDEPEGCVLPANAQRIARQGVTVELTPVLIKAGKFATGIPEVDLWLEAVNPYQAKMPSRVFSVDRPAPRTTTWPC